MFPYAVIIDSAESNLLRCHFMVSNYVQGEREPATWVANENTLDQGNVHPAAWNMGNILSKEKSDVKINSLMLDCTKGKLIRDSSLCGCSVGCLLI